MKLGVVGNGMIVDWLFRDIRELPQVRATALCVRENSVEKGRKLAEAGGGLALYTDYGTFLKEGDFDTVYIGIANHVHYEYALRALEAGKHVICEKPFTVRAEEARRLAATAREKGLFLWEAFKIPYSPIFSAVQEHLPEIGEVRMVQCNFSRISGRYDKYATGVILPAFDPACAGGCLYDINVYNLHFVTALFGRPQQVHYFASRGYNGVDLAGTGILQYDGFYAVCTGAKDSSSRCFAAIQGTKGFIHVEGPVSSATHAEVVLNDGSVRRIAEDHADGALTDELREFARQHAAGDYDACCRMLEHSVMMMDVLEAAAAAV